MEEKFYRNVIISIILVALLVLTYFLLKPLLLSIIFAIILAYILLPFYKYLNKYIKNKSLASILVCTLVFFIIVIPAWFLIPLIIKQTFRLFSSFNQLDLVTPLGKIFPSLIESEEIKSQVASLITSFVSKIVSSFTSSISELVLNLPTLTLQAVVVFFVLFYLLRDSNEFVSHIKDLLPFSKEIEKKLFDQTKSITSSVLYGQIIIGFIQGILAGFGFFIFGVPNAILLTFLATIAGVFPIVGPTIIWIPVVLYLFMAGNTFAAIGVLFFGILSSFIDNFLRPVIVSKMTKIHSSILLIGMVGGLFLFGILGFIIGPLILAYVLVILELYKKKKKPGFFIQQQNVLVS
jgi:predicted PurR-regulated permease PerM